MVRGGHDDDFQRGDNSYDNFYMWGDTSYDPPFRTLGAIDQGPFFAVQMESGALGTAGGPKTNANAQVLDWNGDVIPGLYAAGNAMAAVLGEAGISINRMRQYDHAAGTAPVLIVTHKTTRAALDVALDGFGATGVVTGDPVSIRIEQV